MENSYECELTVDNPILDKSKTTAQTARQSCDRPLTALRASFGRPFDSPLTMYFEIRKGL